MSRRLDPEKLEVYQASLAFIPWQEPLLRELPKSIAVTDQLDRASTSVPLNIAQGNGKFTGPDRCRYSMRVALIKANSSYRWHDEGPGRDSD